MELLDWLADTKGDVANLWGMENVVVGPTDDDKATLLKIFSAEQLKFIQRLIENTVAALEFHNKEDEEAHPVIRDKVDKNDARMRNHRHELGSTYSAKAEF